MAVVLVLTLFVFYKSGGFPITGFFIAGDSGTNYSNGVHLESLSNQNESSPSLQNGFEETNITTKNLSGNDPPANKTKNGRGWGGNWVNNPSVPKKPRDFEISLISPIKNVGGRENVTFYYNVSYDEEIDYCKLIIDGHSIEISYEIKPEGLNNFSAYDLKSGKHFWEIFCRSKDGENLSSQKRKIVTFSRSSGFEVPENLDDLDMNGVKGMFFKRKGFGAINFLGDINLSDLENLNEHMFIDKNLIGIDSDYLPQLNQPAVLTLEGLVFQNPVIFRNGLPCLECQIISYSNGNVIFRVEHFSNYSANVSGGSNAPSGATVSAGTPERVSANYDADPADAYAGNVTELTIYGDSITSAWQGYYGQVSGVIRLANSLGNAMYNWSYAAPSGEVYASTAESIIWDDITCFDISANGTALETAYNLASQDADGVEETFSSTYGSDLIVGSITLSGCDSARLFGSNGAPTFEEVILTADAGTTPIFTSVLNQDTTGFDGASHDFEMLVLDDGHGSDSDATTYNFYVELG